MFAEFREELHSELMKDGRDIKSSCTGFFKDPRHVASHFQWLTSVSPLNGKIEQNLFKQIDLMYLVLQYKNQTVEFKECMQEVEQRIQVEFNGSRTLKDIQIIRSACSVLDKGKEASLIRLDHEEEVDTSPHLKAVQIDKSFVFGLWAEGKELLSMMDFATAIAAFLHTAFCFDMQYPKGAQLVADIIQRRVAEYGDNTGKSIFC